MGQFDTDNLGITRAIVDGVAVFDRALGISTAGWTANSGADSAFRSINVTTGEVTEVGSTMIPGAN